MSLPRFMIAAPSSGSGKTLVTCGILQTGFPWMSLAVMLLYLAIFYYVSVRLIVRGRR